MDIGDKCYRIMCSKFIKESIYQKYDDMFFGDTIFKTYEEAADRLKEIQNEINKDKLNKEI